MMNCWVRGMACSWSNCRTADRQLVRSAGLRHGVVRNPLSQPFGAPASGTAFVAAALANSGPGKPHLRSFIIDVGMPDA
jgi:hypothetical protein